MSANNWKSIWNKKSVVSFDLEEDEYLRFCELKKANGFDVAVGDADAYYGAFYQSWLDFYNMVVDLVGKDIDSIFEVGCGNGVNLYMFQNRLGKKTRLGGVDYSTSMIESSLHTIGGGDFSCCGADEIVPSPKYDIVMAESVFQYFQSLDYTEKVLRTMIEKSNKLTYLGEIHDKKYEQELLEYRRKTIENYDEKYEGLTKLFIDKKWIEDIAAKYNKNVLFTDINNPEYINGKYEYNCFIY